jgi:hypothetical protein
MASGEQGQGHIPLPKISKPANGALAHAGYTSLDQLTSVSEAEIADLHGMGPKGVRLLREALAAHGLSFAPARGKEG